MANPQTARNGLQMTTSGDDEREPALPLVESEADSGSGGEGEENPVHYYFPVEIEVRAAPEPIDPQEIVARALDRVAQRLENS